MSLEKYNEKRDFDQTSEPKGSRKKTKEKLIFVVQRHAATRLHYDFRLEMEGVLKSWAIPKGPSLNPKDKRLAMQVEDHPYEYRTFEGTIPQGNYGAGEVEIWDKGTYEPINKIDGKSDEDILLDELKSGSIKIVINGEKLRGEFTVFKIHGNKSENTWLLVKHNDNFATTQEYNAENYTSASSKVTKLAIQKYKNYEKPKVLASSEENKIDKEPKHTREEKPDEVQRKQVEPFSIKPMLANVGDSAFDDKDWIFEIKWDGYRAIADLTDTPLLYSRNGLSFEDKFPALYADLKQQQHSMIVDGEIVAFDNEGVPSFQMLQHLSDYEEATLMYQVFDLLYLNGYSTEDIPLLQRKELLKDALMETSTIKFCDHVDTNGKDFFEVIKKSNIEGMIAKKKTSKYHEGSRSNEWLKVKNQKTDEAIIVGYTEPKGSRRYFGALILGRYKNGVLKYIGHAGTGFSDKRLKEIYSLLHPYKTNILPFESVPPINATPTWLEPTKVCSIKYTEKTESGVFRHPVFLGIRDDLNASDLYKESMEKEKRAETSNKNKVEDKAKKESESELESKTQKGSESKVKFTNRHKLYWKEEKITKGDLIDYYMSISEFILPHLIDRAQSLHRFPEGVDGLNFYHKDAGKDAPSWVKTVRIFSESNNKEIEYIVCNDKDTLGYLINLGCIELNPWNNKIQHHDYPDYIILDIDPSPKNSFQDVIKVAKVIKQVLDIAHVEGFCKTSGSTGIHILIPTGANYSYEHVRDFAHILMRLVNKQLPKITTLERALDKRGDRIYLDYLQNRVGQTIACVYSVRPKRGATVSMPLEWSELSADFSIKDFTIHNALERINNKGDLFSSLFSKVVNIQKSLDLLNSNLE